MPINLEKFTLNLFRELSLNASLVEFGQKLEQSQLQLEDSKYETSKVMAENESLVQQVSYYSIQSMVGAVL